MAPRRKPCVTAPHLGYRVRMDALTYAEVGATAGEMPAGYHHVRARR